MAYYTKLQVSEIVKETLERAKKNEIRIMSNIEESAFDLGDEKDLIPLFWLETSKVDGSGNLNIKMDGKVFVKIEFDLYCDDRYALDCYQACRDGKTVAEIVSERNIAAQESANSIGDLNKEDLENKISNEIKKDIK